MRPSVFTFGAKYSDAFYAQLKYIHDHSEPKDAVYGIIRQDDDFGKEVEAGYERAVKEFGVKDGIRPCASRKAPRISPPKWRR